MSVELWFALTLLDTDWSPLPTFTPGLMFAPAFTSVLLMPTLASTPTFGFTLYVLCANAGLKAPSTAAAATLKTKFFRFIQLPPFWVMKEAPQVACPQRAGILPTVRVGNLSERVGLLQNQQPIHAAVAILVDLVH